MVGRVDDPPLRRNPQQCPDPAIMGGGVCERRGRLWGGRCRAGARRRAGRPLAGGCVGQGGRDGAGSGDRTRHELLIGMGYSAVGGVATAAALARRRGPGGGRHRGGCGGMGGGVHGGGFGVNGCAGGRAGRCLVGGRGGRRVCVAWRATMGREGDRFCAVSGRSVAGGDKVRPRGCHAPGARLAHDCRAGGALSRV